MSSWLRRLFGPSVPKARRQPARRFIPEIVTLEERCTPSLGSPFAISSTTDNENEVKVATSANGNSVAVYARVIDNGNNSFNRDIFARRIDSAGAIVGSEIPVTNSSNNELDPDVAIDDTGNFVVVWTEKSGEDTNVAYRTYNSAGLTTHFGYISVWNSIDVRHARVAMSATGKWVCVFSAAALEGNDVFAKRFDTSAKQIGATIAVSANALRDEVRPEIDCNDSGGFAVSFEKAEAATKNYTLRVHRYSAGGKLLGGIAVATEKVAFGHFGHDVAIRNNGGTIVAFRDPSSPLKVSVRTITKLGVLSATKTLFAGSLPTFFDGLAIAVNRVTGKFVVATQHGTSVAVIESTFALVKSPVINVPLVNDKPFIRGDVAMNKSGKYLIGLEKIFTVSDTGLDTDITGTLGTLV